MNVQERDELLRLLRSLEQTRVPVKDLAAENLIRDACARQPDALYLLVQRVLVLQSALAAAQSRIAQPQGVTPPEPAPRPWTQGLLAQGAAVAAGAAAGVMAASAAASLLGDAGRTLADGTGDWLDSIDPSEWV